MLRSEKDWVHEYERRGALWIHDGNLKRPHALLTSGKHSEGFFNSEVVMEDPLLLDQAAGDLLQKLVREGFSHVTLNRVVGPAMGAITLAHDLARHISENRMDPCLRAYTEPSTDERGRKTMVFKKTTVHAGEEVLLVEDVLTTGGSVEMAAQAVTEKGGFPVSFVGVLVNRSSLKEVNDKRVVALINHPMPMWEPSECPLCKQGSESLRPKENWQRLNAAY